jgi:hypothetical protein
MAARVLAVLVRLIRAMRNFQASDWFPLRSIPSHLRFGRLTARFTMKSWVLFRFSRGRKKSPAFVNAESLHLSPLHPWQVHTSAGVVNQHLPAYGLPERGLEHCVRVFDGSRGQPALKHLSVDALDVELEIAPSGLVPRAGRI